MAGDSDDLDNLFESVADGESVDWDKLEREAPDEESRAIIRQLRLIAEVAQVHRSQVDETPDPETTVPVPVPVGARGSAAWPPPRLPHVATAPAPGEGGSWGHLLLVRKIGEGSYGEVYHAHDTWLDHPVALKLLKREAESRVQPSDLLHEARKLARVRHVNVVTVHGADRHDGRVGFWMDLVDGETLAARVAKGRLSAGEAVSIGQEVCRALAAVHQAKLIHRDVKAQNVMRAHDGGRIILMDFGAGEFVGDAIGSRAQGTPLYLAPELLRGESANVRTDIYAAGVLLYHLVTGSFPVEAASPAALVEAHQKSQRRRLRDERPDLPESFIAIVERAIDPNPERRYNSAGEMEAKLAGEPITGPRPFPLPLPSAPTPAAGAVENIKRFAIVAAALLVFTGVLGFVAARTFEVALRIDPDFSLGLADVLTVGTQGFLPFVVWWTVFGALTGLVLGVRLLLPARVVSGVKRLFSPLESTNPEILGMVLFLAGALLAVVLTWNYVQVFAALLALWRDPQVPADAISILDRSNRSVHEVHGVYSAALSFALGVAIWRWFPRLEKRAADVSLLRSMRWATLAIAMLIVALAAAPRRICWENFTVASFGSRAALVIGTTRDEYLLYASSEANRPRYRVRRDASDLQLTGETQALFDRNR
ncbi:MAG TPA: serine/threonine-protein kinase [Vicinamibacterales bacterium]|nr:serine/threonine-protein kinase [Vicinamibacterales bacterium]